MSDELIDPADIKAQLDAVPGALIAQSITAGGRTTQFRPLSELLKAGAAATEQARTNGTGRMYYSKGLPR